MSPRKRGHAQGAAADRSPATPETLVKSRPDHLRSLSNEHQDAARDIHEAWRLKVSPLLSRAQNVERQARGRVRVKARHILLLKRYDAWTSEMTRRRLALDAVIDMVVDGSPPYEVDARRMWGLGVAAERLIEGLDLYRRLAPGIVLTSADRGY